MQLRHAQRQLLSRCTLRWYSVGTVPANDTSQSVPASGTPTSPPRLKRPLATSFGGISIENVVIPTRKPRSGTNRPPRSGNSYDKYHDMRRTNQVDRSREQGQRQTRASYPSGQDDGRASLSFSTRLQLHEQKMTTGDTGDPPPSDVHQQQRRQQQSRQSSQPTQRSQNHHHGRQRGQKEEQRNENRVARATANAERKRKRKLKASSMMTRPSAFSFDLHAHSQTTTTTTTATEAPKAKANMSKNSSSNANNNPSSSSSNASAPSQQPTVTTPSTPADRSARLNALSSTNLNALFRTRDASSARGGADLSLASASASASASPASVVTARVRSVLERSAGDYSRFLPRRVGVRKNASRLPALRTARHALAGRRDVSLEQRRVALHIIGGLAQPTPSSPGTRVTERGG